MATHKIIVLALGSDGDVNPMLAIARHLVSLGQDVEFLANGYFAAKVEAEGLKFFPVGDAAMYERALQDSEVWDAWRGFSAIWRVLFESIPVTYQVLNERLTPGSIVVGTSLAHAARVTQELTGVKLATVHLQPTAVISAYTPPVGPGGAIPDNFPLLIKRAYVELLDTFLIDRACRSDINAFRGQFGLPPVKNVFTRWTHSPDLVIMAWPEWFAPPQPDWPQYSICTGFPLYHHPSSTALSQATLDFINSGSPPVVFTAGSAMAQSADHFRCALEALDGQPIRGVFVSRYDDQIPERLPANIHHTRYEPFDMLFQHAAAVQHHGGIGTSVQSLLAAKPQLIVPYAHDQFDNASRFERLNVAKETRLNRPADWRRKLKILLSDDSINNACLMARERLLIAEDPLQSIGAAIMRLAGEDT